MVKAETSTLWAVPEEEIVGVSKAKQGYIFTSHSKIRKQTTAGKFLEWSMSGKEKFFAPAIDANTNSILATLPILSAKKSQKLYSYTSSHHTSAASEEEKPADDVLHLSGCPKAAFDEEVLSVHAAPSIEGGVLVVKKNGSVSIFKGSDSTPTVKPISEIVPPQSHSAVWSFLEEASVPTTPVIGYLYILLSDKSKAYKFVVATLISDESKLISTADGSCNIFDLPANGPAAEVLTCCADSKNRNIAIFWSTGSLEVYHFASAEGILSSAPSKKLTIPTTSPDGTPIFSLASHSAPQANGKSNGKRKAHELDAKSSTNVFGSGFASVFLHPNFLVLVGRDRTGVSNVLTLWEVTYGSLQTKCELPNGITHSESDADDTPTKSPPEHIIQLITLHEGKSDREGRGRGVLCVTEHHITSHKFHSLRSNLSAALGRNNLSYVSEGGLSAYTPSTIKGASNNIVVGTLASLLTKNQSQTQDTLPDRITKFLNRQHDDAHTVRDTHEYIQLCNKIPTRTHELDKHQYSISPTAIAALVQEGINLQCYDGVNILIKKGLVPNTSVPSLMVKLLATSKLESLMLCIQHVQSISDGDLVGILMLVLDSTPSDCLACLTSLSPSSPSLPSDPVDAKNTLLEMVLAVKPENIFVYSFLRMLSLAEVLVMLKFLLDKLQGFSTGSSTDSTITYSNVLKWLGMIMDTHFAQLILTPDCHPLIRSLSKVVGQEVIFTQHAALLAGELLQFLPSPPSSSTSSSSSSSSTQPVIQSPQNKKPRVESNIGQYRLESVSLF